MNHIVLIKCGGSMLQTLSDEFYAGIKMMKESGLQPVIVHGGGPAINEKLDQLSIKSEFHNGLRKTTEEVLEVVEMVLSGSMSNLLVRNLAKQGLPAISMTGLDHSLIQARAKDLDTLGYVGDITSINAEFLSGILELGVIPVISPLAQGIDGADFYNVNADTAAGAIAVALQAESLLFVTDVPGIMNRNEWIEKASKKDILKMIDEEIITGGMVPKVEAALNALESGMPEVMIVSGKNPLMNDGRIVGTTIHQEMEVVH